MLLTNNLNNLLVCLDRKSKQFFGVTNRVSVTNSFMIYDSLKLIVNGLNNPAAPSDLNSNYIRTNDDLFQMFSLTFNEIKVRL